MTSVADGVHAALMWGGIISAAAVVLALFVRRPRPVMVPEVS